MPSPLRQCRQFDVRLFWGVGFRQIDLIVYLLVRLSCQFSDSRFASFIYIARSCVSCFSICLLAGLFASEFCVSRGFLRLFKGTEREMEGERSNMDRLSLLSVFSVVFHRTGERTTGSEDRTENARGKRKEERKESTMRLYCYCYCYYYCHCCCRSKSRGTSLFFWSPFFLFLLQL